MPLKKWSKYLIPALLLLTTPLPAPIIKIDPKKESRDLTYAELVCSEQDKAHIYEIITTLAENSEASLFLKQSRLYELQAKIIHLHPMKFMTSIFTNPRLKYCMINVFDHFFKRNGFMNGLVPRMEGEANRGKLLALVDEFAAELNVPAESIRTFFHTRDWDGLVRYLIET